MKVLKVVEIDQVSGAWPAWAGDLLEAAGGLVMCAGGIVTAMESVGIAAYPGAAAALVGVGMIGDGVSNFMKEIKR